MRNYIFIIMNLFVSLSIEAASFESFRTWDKNEISVCLNSTIAIHPLILKSLDTFKDELKTIVNKEFTKEKTGIHFIGWGNCSASSVTDATINFSSEMITKKVYDLLPNFEFIGGSTDALNSGVRPNINLTFYVLKQDDGKEVLPRTDEQLMKILDFTALHEFGHLASLAHEHLIFFEKSKDDINCKNDKFTFEDIVKVSESFFKNNDLKIFDQYRILHLPTAPYVGIYETPFHYDNSSIMNYCYIGLLSHSIVKDVFITQKFSAPAAAKIKFKKNEEVETNFGKIGIPDENIYRIENNKFIFNIELSKTDQKTLKQIYR